MKVWELKLPMPPNLGQLLDPENSPINPKWFPYGSFPLYLLKLSGHLLSFWRAELSGPELRLVGRAISAIFDTGTVLLVYLIGSRVYTRGAGVMAAAFSAFSVIHIQTSHFFTADLILTFFVAATVLAGLHVAKAGTRRASVFMGLAAGLGLATKISIAPILITIVVAHLLYLLRGTSIRDEVSIQAVDSPHPSPPFDPPEAGGQAPRGRGKEDRMRQAVSGLVIALCAAAIVFTLAQPYALIDRDRFLADTREQSEMVRRIRDYPYTRQYEDTPPYLYHIIQSTKWGLGIPLGIVSWLGLGFMTIRGLIVRRSSDLLILSWVIPYFMLTGGFPVKFMRYMLPLTPFLAIMAAEMLSAWARTMPRKADLPSLLYRLAPAIAAFIILAFSALYSIAFLSIYSKPHSAVQLSQWINQYVPEGATIAKEHWEEGLPDLGRYKKVDLQMYEPDTSQKLEHIVSTLTEADYIVFYSNRLYGAIPRLPDRYPMAADYYKKLFGGELGYSLIAHRSSYPTLLGVRIEDDTFARPGLPAPFLTSDQPSIALSLGHADESFTVYDHPLVMLFKKDETFSQERTRDVLASSLPSALPKQAGLLFSSQEEYIRHRFQGTGSDLFPLDSVGNRFPLLSLLVTVELLSLLVILPLLLIASHLPDKGFMLAKLIGILAISYVPWLLSSLKLLPFARETEVLTILTMVVLCALVLWKRGAQIWGTLRHNWRMFVVEEAVFLLAFLFLYQVRLLNPDLWHSWRGGEKPMDFAYLNALVRSQYMPPYDPWFAGGYLNYYYFGQVIIAALIKLTGILPSVAYNLAVPLLFALSAGTCFSIAYNMAAVTRISRSILVPAIAAGISGILFVLVLGNLDGVSQLAGAFQRVGGVQMDSTIPGLSGLIAWVTGVLKIAISGAADLPVFDYWRSSRMMAPTPSITEFPYFTFLFADLHAHLISIPFTLGMILVFWTLVSLPASASLFRNIAFLFIAGWVLGAVRWINSWDYPTYLILGMLTVAVREYVIDKTSKVRIDSKIEYSSQRALPEALEDTVRVLSTRLRREGNGLRWIIFILRGCGSQLAWGIVLKYAVIVVSSLLLYLPLSMSYELFYSGVQPTPETTKVQQYLAIHGLFLFIVLTFVAAHLWEWAGKAGMAKAFTLYIRYWWKIPRIISLSKILSREKRVAQATNIFPFVLTVGAILVLLIGMLFSMTAAFLTVLATAILAVIATTFRQPKSITQIADLYATSLLLIAVLIGIGAEIIAIQGDIGRMNTVFKFYLQAWVLYGIGSAYALWWLFSRLPYTKAAHLIAPSSTRLTASSSIRLRRITTSVDRWRGLWSLALTVLVVGTAVYPIAATPVRINDRFAALPPTNDGMAFMVDSVYQDEYGPLELKWDYDAITWMQDNLEGTPVIMEGVTPIYRWGARVSVYTGLPTVIGWDWHQKQQRWGYQWMVDERIKDVSKTFGTVDQAMALSTLKKYEVEYVFIGQLEKLYYTEEGIAKFNDMAQRGVLDLVYENQEVNIFKVISYEG